LGKRRSPAATSSAAFINLAEESGFSEVVLPSIEPSDIYADKAGPEVLGQMYVFPDRKGRSLCLRPEGTATCQLLAQGPLRFQKDVRLWYEARCWRYERPQAGRYREFTQFGVEALNPSRDYRDEMMELGRRMIGRFARELDASPSVARGLAYYVGDGFEISCPILGAQKQVLGGGRYAEGIGFAIGVDRLMLAMEREKR
jgi:histidyl-tRNA synthetase